MRTRGNRMDKLRGTELESNDRDILIERVTMELGET